MSFFKMTLAGAALVALPVACAGYETTDTTDPTVSFAYTATEEAEEVADKADDYCDDRYDTDAYLLETGKTAEGYEATFACR